MNKVVDSISQVIEHIRDTPTFQRLLRNVRAYADLPNLALPRASRLVILTTLHRELAVPVLLVTDRADHALTIMDELALWAPNIPRLHFPEPTPLFYENSPWNETTRRDRLNVLTTLAAQFMPGARVRSRAQSESNGGVKSSVEGLNSNTQTDDLSRAEARQRHLEALKGGILDITNAPAIIITPVRALMTRTLPRRDFVKHTRLIKTGQIAQPDTLARFWVGLGYEPADTVIASGQFARRGGILDIWPPAEPGPLRLDFFGDEIETIRYFDPSTQITTDKVTRTIVTPAREFIPKPMENTGDSEDREFTEFDIPRLHSSASLIGYLPQDALILFDDLEAIEHNSQEIEAQAVEMREEYLRDNEISVDFPLPYIPWFELFDEITIKRYLQLGPGGTAQKSELAHMFASNPRFGGRLSALMDHLHHQLIRSDQIILVSRQASRLKDLWKTETSQRDITGSHPEFIPGSLTEGFLLSPPGEKRVHLLTDGEIFGWRRPQPRQRRPITGQAPEAIYADLQLGDWVVHVDHGIGRFMGLVRRSIDTLQREYLKIEYDDGDELFVPVHQADRISRYVGPDGRQPSRTRLNSAQWKNAKTRVQKAVEEVAKDLLELYAKRQVIRGHSFSKDTEWQRELEASFPYIETEDQIQVLEEVKRDMEGQLPMDRLICGDVGYGKTEIALRSAFKAVMDSKQVALLVPTTVLAQQHYDTFRERLAPFPIEVEMLSRFRTYQQQQEILLKLAIGTVDIVIGTHRLLSGDVEFKDLGLLIIDEEQRFGVTHKETLKKMRTEVDVLTMTATPIPRTLYLALTGARDISTINTPPEERLPIVTHVGPYDQKLVRQAILRELERGGQVFFVHNRVQTIQGMRNHLKNIVPEANFAIAHGQMSEEKLSKRMREFSAGKIDVLVSTSIVESGLDIPNANTLIVDRADTFGLAQLYQLRGRVGRAAQQAYAYFFKHRRRSPTHEGRLRLETLAENTQLGAGFSIAMRDLEIRGAGDLLGTRQHGHIAAVGFHLYTRLLAQAVQLLRKPYEETGVDLPMADLADFYAPRPLVSVDLPIPASIPADYIPDRDVRLRLYRRIADIRELEKIEYLAEEFENRFGPLPEEVRALLYQIKVKLLAEKVGAESIYPENGQIVLRFPSIGAEEEKRTFPYLGSDVRISKNAIRLLRNFSSNAWKKRLLEILQELNQWFI